MAIDYTSHPAALVTTAGKMESVIDVAVLRKAIPTHCFQSSYSKSFGYLCRDILQVLGLGAAAYYGIPLIESGWLRFAAWALYGWAQGLVFVGLWVIGHDCGHSAFFPSEPLNHVVGFALHTFMLTPYYSWRSTHRRHHVYANNLSKDLNYVPPARKEYSESLGVDIDRLEELTEDAPIVTFLRILMQQLVGWPWYLLTNITAAESSLPRGKSDLPLGNSHFAPLGSLFRPEEAHLIFLSDLGLVATSYALWTASTSLGPVTLLLLYVQPYLWINHWIVAITYLHHTHPGVPKYENEAWTFIRGALGTIDREFGWIGKHILHNIVEFHVVHHLFPRIPFYHAEEATQAVRPLLGDSYHSDKQRPFLPGIWEAFTKCQWVEPDKPDAAPKDRVMYYRGGPSPPPETTMGIRRWFRKASAVAQKY